MKIYALTPLGKRLARSTQNPDTPGWRIVHYLDNTGYATPDQVAGGTGMDEGEVGTNMGFLRRKGIIKEITKAGGY